jgi:hypothetical protein
MPSQVFRRGETIGKQYVVKRKIGEGQFSEVYEVEKASDGSRVGFGLDRIARLIFKIYFERCTRQVGGVPHFDRCYIFLTAVCAENREKQGCENSKSRAQNLAASTRLRACVHTI